MKEFGIALLIVVWGIATTAILSYNENEKRKYEYYILKLNAQNEMTNIAGVTNVGD